MKNLIISKFGGSAVGIDGMLIPTIIKRINELKKDSKVITVFSAPLTVYNEKQRSLTDIALEIGRRAEKGENISTEILRRPYQKIVNMVDRTLQDDCNRTIDSFLEKTKTVLAEIVQKREFANETRAKLLAYSGEILMANVMNYVLKSSGIKSEVISFYI
ncbi:MAG: aspartate kinase, partial [Nitrosotalea sp.]